MMHAIDLMCGGCAALLTAGIGLLFAQLLARPLEDKADAASLLGLAIGIIISGEVMLVFVWLASRLPC